MLEKKISLERALKQLKKGHIKSVSLDAAPAYRKLNISNEANIGEAALRLNPFTDLKPEDFKYIFTANACVNGFKGGRS